jgi:hypothetical protein
MSARLPAALLWGFWAVMSGWLLRDTYFPPANNHRAIPPGEVFDRFLTQADAFSTTLQIYRGGESVGHAMISVQPRTQAGEARHHLVATGTVTPHSLQPTRGTESAELSFRLSMTFANGGAWRAFELDASAPEVGLRARLGWQHGQELPKVDIRQNDQIILDSAGLESLLRSGVALLPADLTRQITQHPPVLHAVEGDMELAGKRRTGLRLGLDLPGLGTALAWFTGDGLLVRAEVPGGYRLVEPLIHGLGGSDEAR